MKCPGPFPGWLRVVHVNAVLKNFCKNNFMYSWFFSAVKESCYCLFSWTLHNTSFCRIGHSGHHKATKTHLPYVSVQAAEHLQSFIADCDRRTELAKKRLAETQDEISAEVTAKVTNSALPLLVMLSCLFICRELHNRESAILLENCKEIIHLIISSLLHLLS